ncbi:MAG: phage tail protein [Ewingella americana]|jgi:phage protein U|uniref:phage tail protein n=1 Tax=Ewingella americana TaxID=41202 RepID=UPI000C2F8D33|nr:phage tail protein [Ewingella americana]MCI1680022.1 phage tail protein [Ewingella americana]MCI1855017.1 phage tail protein [Ewingella americana]MCI1863494.1 phage tail protein [Ewingella americana]MCI2143364.1 phage tail protein [Ewingella americana]MCI2164521.1 phage tail protein [Ewingella americana]
MLMTLGLMVFERQTLPFQTQKQTTNYRWAKNSRVGLRPSMQFIGLGDETITLTGNLMPSRTGGMLSLLALRTMADGGYAWPLIGGNGWIYGMYVVTDVTNTNTELTSDGTPRKINFEITLKRIDESIFSMYGDLKTQSELLYKDAANLGNKVVGWFS